MYVYACMYACMIEGNRTHDQHTAGTQDTRQRSAHDRNTRPPEKGGKACIYMSDYRQRKKKLKKVKKKLEIRKNRRIFVAVIKNQTSLTIKLQSDENN